MKLVFDATVSLPGWKGIADMEFQQEQGTMDQQEGALGKVIQDMVTLAHRVYAAADSSNQEQAEMLGYIGAAASNMQLAVQSKISELSRTPPTEWDRNTRHDLRNHLTALLGFSEMILFEGSGIPQLDADLRALHTYSKQFVDFLNGDQAIDGPSFGQVS